MRTFTARPPNNPLYRQEMQMEEGRRAAEQHRAATGPAGETGERGDTLWFILGIAWLVAFVVAIVTMATVVSNGGDRLAELVQGSPLEPEHGTGLQAVASRAAGLFLLVGMPLYVSAFRVWWVRLVLRVARHGRAQRRHDRRGAHELGDRYRAPRWADPANRPPDISGTVLVLLAGSIVFMALMSMMQFRNMKRTALQETWDDWGPT